MPVSAEVLETFQRLAAAGNMSTGKAMAQWLEDTLEAAEYMAVTMERARAAPKVVMRELHAYALGLADETGQLMRDIAKKGRKDMAAGGGGVGRACETGPDSPSRGFPVPPPCNTGGKVPESTSKKNKGKS